MNKYTLEHLDEKDIYGYQEDDSSYGNVAEAEIAIQTRNLANEQYRANELKKLELRMLFSKYGMEEQKHGLR